MAYRRPESEATDLKRWRAFISSNGVLLRGLGLPPLVVATEAHWTDLLMHGTLDHHEDPTSFSVASISPNQYPQLVALAQAYFAAGHDFFTPFALKQQDRIALEALFRAPSR